MKEVLMSINPIWCLKIAKGEKNAEIRKTHPREGLPCRVYMYCTKGESLYMSSEEDKKLYLSEITEEEEDMDDEPVNKKVIGEFICNSVSTFAVGYDGIIQDWNWSGANKACVNYNDAVRYIGGGRRGYVWEISDLKIYDTPRSLSEFLTQKGEKLINPPMSWRYVKSA